MIHLKRCCIITGILTGILITCIFAAIYIRSKNTELIKSVAIAQSIADGNVSLPARYASLMLQTAHLQKTDCFVCSIAGFPPDAFFKSRDLDQITYYNMVAFIISGTKIAGDTIPLTITLPLSATAEDDEIPEKIHIEAKITYLTDFFYFAEFAFPRNKLPTNLLSRMNIRCGTGEDHMYSVFVDSDNMHPNIFLNEPVCQE